MNFHLFDTFKKDVATLIHNEFKDSSVDVKTIYDSLVTPPDISLGHFAFAGFILAKDLKKAPNQIVNSLKEVLEKSDLISLANPAGPYINITMNTEYFAQNLLNDILTGSFFDHQMVVDPKKTMIEYSQPNTHKELHVGHMRNLCLGNALVRIFKYCKVPTESATFPGDVGTHVAKCLWYYKKFNSTPPEHNKGAWLGELYSTAHNKLEQELGTPEEEKNRAELTAILKQLHENKGEYFDLWKTTREWSLELMNKVYSWADVSFDHWFFESEVDASSVKLINEYYEKGLFVKDDGAIGCDLSEQKLGFCLLIKSDGNGLYATKDIELARRKFEKGIEQNIYVVDKRQSHHFKQVFATLEKMNFAFATNCYHLAYDFVELPDGAMSSRKGNIIPLTELISKMENTIKELYLNKYENDWDQKEIDQTATIIANGAIKYGMNKIDPMKKIVFEMSEWLKLDGDSGPYIQYVCARINSILNKVADDIKDQAPDYKLLESKEEQLLLVKLANFNTCVASALKNYKTSLLSTYLYELAKAFNSFYAEHSVSKEENLGLKRARFELVKAVHTTLTNGLDLLGIKAPEKM